MSFWENLKTAEIHIFLKKLSLLLPFSRQRFTTSCLSGRSPGSPSPSSAPAPPSSPCGCCPRSRRAARRPAAKISEPPPCPAHGAIAFLTLYLCSLQPPRERDGAGGLFSRTAAPCRLVLLSPCLCRTYRNGEEKLSLSRVSPPVPLLPRARDVPPFTSLLSPAPKSPWGDTLRQPTPCLVPRFLWHPWVQPFGEGFLGW